MTVDQIMTEIYELSETERLEVYLRLGNSISKRKEIFGILEKSKGKGQGVWNKDAQEYVNELRAD